MDEKYANELIEICQIKLEQRLQIIMETKYGYHNFTTGENANTIEKLCQEQEYFTLIRTSKIKYGNYFKYDELTGFLVCIICSIDSSSLKENNLNEIRNWKEHTRYYITKEKEIWFKRYNKYEKAYANNAAQLPIDYTTTININKSNKNHETDFSLDNYIPDLMKVFPLIANYGGDSIGVLNSVFSLNNFLIYSEPRCISDSAQKKLKELSKYKLETITIEKIEFYIESMFKKENILNSYSDIASFKVIIQEKIAEDILVARTFYFSYICNKPYISEIARIYFSKNKIPISFRLNNFQEWIIIPYNKAFDTGRYYCLNNNVELFKNTCLEKFINIYENFDEGYEFKTMVSYMKDQILEQLHKSGLSQISKDIVKNRYSADIKLMLHRRYFYEFHSRCDHKNILEKTGLNRFQVNYFNDKINDKSKKYNFKSDQMKIFHLIQATFGNETFSISYMDDNTFKKIFDLTYYLISCYNNDFAKEFINIILKTYSLKSLVENSEHIITFKENKPFSDPLLILKDTVELIFRLKMQQYFKLKKLFYSIEELKIIHDELTTIYNLKKFEKISEKWKEEELKWFKYIFEDDNYIIKVPENPGEIAEEGIELRHCVKTYIDRVVEGKTIILFLRKKEAPEIPYFTIEVGIDNNIKQIKGFCNKLLNEEMKETDSKTIINFIEKWSQKNKLNFSKNI